MTVYTPRGLKVRISVPEAFAFMKRLGPAVPPFSFLKTVEAIEAIPPVLGLFGLVSGHLLFDTISMVLGSTIALYAIGLFIRANVAPPKELISICTIFSYLNGFGLFLLLAGYLGYSRDGLLGAVTYISGLFISWLIGQCHGFLQIKRAHAESGNAYTQSEISFVKAYLYHAHRLGKSLSLELEDKELLETNWRPLYEIFAYQWPDVARRFVS